MSQMDERDEPRNTEAAIRSLLDEERNMEAAATALTETILYSITTQVKWWRRFAIIAFFFAVGITIVSFANRAVMEEIQEQQVDVDQLVNYVNRLEERRGQPSEFEDEVRPALGAVFRIEQMLCSMPEFAGQCRGDEDE